MKKCNKCLKEKELSEFSKKSRYKDGYDYYCKACVLGHEPHSKPLIEKSCKICTLIKPIGEFRFQDKLKRFTAAYCKVCENKKRDAKRKENPEKETLRLRRKRLKAKYNITPLDYDKLFLLQNGKCRVCKLPETKLDSLGKVQNLSIDHCHSGGQVRGLLCGNCNSMLGHAKDNIKILKEAIKYLKETKTDKSEYILVD